MILIDTAIDTITANYMASNSNDIPYGLTLAQKHDLDWHQATEISYGWLRRSEERNHP